MTASQTLRVRVIILNYEGAELLPQCLPSIVEAGRRSSYPTEVAILDNPSKNAGLDYVRTQFPEVRIFASPRNRILCSFNDYLPEVPEPIVILLNNDIRVDPGFIDPLIEKFKTDPQTFLAVPRVMSFDGKTIEAARAKGGVRFGIFQCDARYPGYEKEALTPSETFSSGFGAFSREKFLALGGYDDRYLPGILEDVDLCYRARKAGYHLYYEPQSVVYHMGQMSFKKEFGVTETAVLAHRNTFLFMWKNYSGFSFWISHLFFLPLRLAFAACRGKWPMLIGFYRAVKMTVKGRV